MESVTLKAINELLKDAPKNVLERVFGYVEGLMESETQRFELTEEQKNSLRGIKKRSYTEHAEIEAFVSDFKTEYDI